MSRRVSRLVAGLVLAGLLASAVGLQLLRDRWYGSPQPADSLLYIRSPETMKRMALSFSGILADLYWIRAVQYYGGRRLSKDPNRNYNQLYPLLDITTSLDPMFNIAYRFGAIFLSEPLPGGAGRPDRAIDLLEKGFRLNPNRWEYPYDIGFVHYWTRQDFAAAAEWFQKASEVPGAPWWVRSMAAVTAAQGGNRRASRMLWQIQLENAESEWVRNNATERLQQLDAMDQIDELTWANRQFASRHGRFAESWDELARAGLVRGRPLDPAGLPYVLDPQSGGVSLSPESPLNPLPTGERGR